MGKRSRRQGLLAKPHPQAAYVLFTHGLSSWWTYLIRTVNIAPQFLQQLEDAIGQLLLPAVTGKSVLRDLKRELIALPAHMGGLSIPIFRVSPHTQSIMPLKRSQHHL